MTDMTLFQFDSILNSLVIDDGLFEYIATHPNEYSDEVNTAVAAVLALAED